MKNKTSIILSALLAVSLFAPLASAKTAEPARLQVLVETPTVFDLLVSDDISDALAVHLSDAFRRGGFEGRIAQISHLDDADAALPLLEVSLIDWRTRPTGSVDCRISATLTALDGTQTRLGVFSGTALTWQNQNRFTVSRAFEDAALDAMRSLYRDYRKLDTANADELAE